MDIKQPVCLFGHCRTLCVQWWATWCVYPLIHQQDIIYSLQRNSLLIFMNSLGSIRVIIWQRPFGKHWNYMASLGGHVSHILSMYSANIFTDHCYCNGQCQQQQHNDDITWVTMPAARHIIFSIRCSHAMHASYNPFSSNQGIIITFLSRLVSNCLFSSWKGLERYQGLRARRLLHKVPTIKTTLPGLSHRIMTTMQQLTSILTWLMWIWTQTLILT